MGRFTKVGGKTTLQTAEAASLIQTTNPFTKAIGRKIKCMAKVYLGGKMAVNTTVNFLKILFMDLEL